MKLHIKSMTNFGKWIAEQDTLVPEGGNSISTGWRAITRYKIKWIPHRAFGGMSHDNSWNITIALSNLCQDIFWVHAESITICYACARVSLLSATSMCPPRGVLYTDAGLPACRALWLMWHGGQRRWKYFEENVYTDQGLKCQFMRKRRDSHLVLVWLASSSNPN